MYIHGYIPTRSSHPGRGSVPLVMHTWIHTCVDTFTNSYTYTHKYACIWADMSDHPAVIPAVILGAGIVPLLMHAYIHAYMHTDIHRTIQKFLLTYTQQYIYSGRYVWSPSSHPSGGHCATSYCHVLASQRLHQHGHEGQRLIKRLLCARTNSPCQPLSRICKSKASSAWAWRSKDSQNAFSLLHAIVTCLQAKRSMTWASRSKTLKLRAAKTHRMPSLCHEPLARICKPKAPHHGHSAKVAFSWLRAVMTHRRRGGGLGSRPKKMYGERLRDGVEYHLMSPTPLR